MIQQETILKVIDNSGVKTVKCLKVLGGFKRKNAYLGDIIVVSVKTTKNFSKIKQKEIYKALVVRTKKEIKKKDGCSITLHENAVSLINKQSKKTLLPTASRIFGPISKKLSICFSDFTKIAGETL